MMWDRFIQPIIDVLSGRGSMEPDLDYDVIDPDYIGFVTTKRLESERAYCAKNPLEPIRF